MNPLETLWGTIIAGIVLTAILHVAVSFTLASGV